MSTFWIFVNHTKQERIDPIYVGNGGNKECAITNGDAARLLTFVMFNAWHGDHVTIEPDWDLERLSTFERWSEVSEREIAAFNKAHDPIRFCVENLPANPALR